jgi:hypothetical protein
VLLELFLRIKLCSADRAFIGLARFMFFRHPFHPLSDAKKKPQQLCHAAGVFFERESFLYFTSKDIVVR